jgi:hypothetical protein
VKSPPADHHDRRQQAKDHLRRVRAEARVERREDHKGCDGERGDRRQCSRRGTDGGVEDGDERSWTRHRRQRRYRHGVQRDGDGPAPAEEEGCASDGSERDIEDERQRVVVRRRDRDDEDAARGREQKEQDVDDPVPR